MRGVARYNDATLGTCKHPSHPPITVGGKIITASGTLVVNGRAVARLNDLVKTDCGHYDYINSASGTVIGDPEPVARLNDTVGKNGIYVAKIITASGDVSNT